MRYFVLLLLSLSWCGISAQTTLDDYRSSVIDYSRELKIARSQSAEASETMAAVRTGYLPRLSVDGSFTTTFRHYTGVEHWTFAVIPQILQTVYGGGAIRAASDQASLGYDIALCQEEFTLLDVRYAADYAYWNLSAMMQFRGAMKEYVNIINSLKSVIDWRFSEGYIAKGDVLMIETRLSEAKYQLITAEQNYAVALHNFNILRGDYESHDEKLAQTIRDSIPLPERVPLDEALALRPDYTASSLAIESSKAGIRAARAPFNPQISVGVGGIWQPYSPNRTGGTSIDGSVFLKVSIPIFHWGERRRTVGAAKARLDQSELQTSMLHDNILRDEINGWTAVIDSHAQVTSTAENLRIATENLDISTYSYNEGQATILDVMQAQLSWIQIYTNSINAMYNYAVAVAAYQRITAR